MSESLNNYIVTDNPYSLAVPPAWWLKKLWDTDSALVVFPSRVRAAYILARRRSKSNAMAEMVKLEGNLLRKSAGMDGDVLATHNLVYVRHLLGNSVRRNNIFQWLKDADTWDKSSGLDFATRVERQDEAHAAHLRNQMLDDIDARSRDAWRSYQARTGRRSGFTYNTAKQAKQAG